MIKMPSQACRLPVVICLVLCMAARICLSKVIHSVSFSLPPPPPMTGTLTPNSILYDAERLHNKQIPAPHSYVTLRGEVYAVTKNSLVVNVAGCQPIVIADLKPRGCRGVVQCGVLTSIRVGPQGLLLVVDAYRGLFQVHPVSGAFRQLFDSSTLVSGRPSVYLNDAAILRDGTILISDSSSTFGQQDEFWIRFEGRADGRLIAFNPLTGNASVVSAGLAYPNGVELTFDGNSVLVAETGRARIVRVDLTKKNLFRRSVFVDNLPGMPENIRKSDKGSYWVGVSYPRFAGSRSPMDEYSLQPSSRDILAKHRTKSQLQTMMSRRGLAVELSKTGNVIDSIHDNTGRRVSHVTEVIAKDGVMYVGTRDQNAVMRVVLPDSPHRKMRPETKLQLLVTRCQISKTQYKAAMKRLKENSESSISANKMPHPIQDGVSIPFSIRAHNHSGNAQPQTYTRSVIHRGQPHPRSQRTQHVSSRTRATHRNIDALNSYQSPWNTQQEQFLKYKSHQHLHPKRHNVFSNAPRVVQDAMKRLFQNDGTVRWRPTVSKNLLRENGHHNVHSIMYQRFPQSFRRNDYHQTIRNPRIAPVYSQQRKTGHTKTTIRKNDNTHLSRQNTQILPQPNVFKLQTHILNHSVPFDNKNQHLIDGNRTSQSQTHMSAITHPVVHQNSYSNQPRDSTHHTTSMPVWSSTYSDNGSSSINQASMASSSNSSSSPTDLDPKAQSISTNISNHTLEITLPLFVSENSVTPIAPAEKLQSQITGYPNIQIETTNLTNSFPNTNNTNHHSRTPISNQPNTSTAVEFGNHVTLTINIQVDNSTTNASVTESHQQHDSNASPNEKWKRVISTTNGSKPGTNEILLESPGNVNRNLTKRQTIGSGSLFSLLKIRNRPPHMETPDPNDPSRQQHKANKVETQPERPTNPVRDAGRLIDLQRRLGQLKSHIQKVRTLPKGPSYTPVDQQQLQRIRNMMITLNRGPPSSSSRLPKQNVTQTVIRQLYSFVPAITRGANRNRMTLFENFRARNVSHSQTVSRAAMSPLFQRLASTGSNTVPKLMSHGSRTPTTPKTDDTTRFIEIVSRTGRVVRVPVHPRLLQRILLKRLEHTLKSKGQ